VFSLYRISGGLLMDNYGAGGIGAGIVAILGLIYSAVNHKRIRSNCCGYLVSASVDIEPTTPPQPQTKD
jgi:hypothetical protein